MEDVAEGVVLGLAANLDELGRPLCPCRFYPDKREEVKHRTWICACDDMQIYKYCHCLLFVTSEGLPITEYLPEDHDGRQTYGLVKDPTPERGRSMRDKAAAREAERRERGV
jgi:ferredoxin-thioredoxin reductase catalytic chain